MKHDSRAPRILAGFLRGRVIATPPGRSTRPLRALARRSLFDILGPWIEDATVLDLYAGAGTVGLEAISRGAERAVLVERARPAREALSRSVQTFGIEDRVEIRADDVVDYLEHAPSGPFDFIFLGPPYPLYRGAKRKGLDAVLERVGSKLHRDGRLVLETPTELARPPVPGLRATEARRYGDSTLHFLEHEGLERAADEALDEPV